MHTLTDWLRLAFRICLSCTLMIEAILGMLPHLNVYNLSTVTAGMDDPFHKDAAFGVLYFIISIWLLFGIKTNIVAALGGILLVLPAMVMAVPGSDALAIKLALATVFALPLALFGGGRYAVNDRCDWREAF
ncbi:MAG: hypothetical protein HRT60_01355 [Dinoroseobacter sp.]|nr:hypothetical protein [Dinoroseobacter sp.]NQZ71690.1 hypothetical protein [Dinoroseobacter sp.]